MNNLIFIVAYNHENFIAKVLERLPKDIKATNFEILIIDDASKDKTYSKAIKWANANNTFNIKVLKNPSNLGYGGNQKIGFQYAIENNFDTVTLLHGDGQYAPEIIVDLINFHISEKNSLTLGSRMINKLDALKGRMPLYKFFGNIILTTIQNLILKTKLSEFHTGYRVYSIKDLTKIMFNLNTNDYHFDTEIIIQHISNKFKIGEYPIPTFYGDEISYVNGFKYAFNIIKETIKFKLQRLGIFYEEKYEVNSPEVFSNKSDFLSTNYYINKLIKENSKIIDFGPSEGNYHTILKKNNCYIKTINGTLNKHLIDENEILNLDEKLPKDIQNYNYILLPDIIEHLHKPEIFLEKLSRQTNPKQILIASTGNIAFITSRLMLLMGFFNYSKKGILDKTHTRLFNFHTFKKIFTNNNFKIIKTIGIPAPYPIAIKNKLISKTLLNLNQLLIRIFPRIFSYQILLVLEPSANLKQMLIKTLRNSQ